MAVLPGMFDQQISTRGLKALVFFLLSTLILSQEAKSQRFEFGLGIGALNYKGDLNPHLNPILSRPGFQAIFRYNYSMTVVGRINAAFGRLVGDGSLSPDLYISKRQPNKFETIISEVIPIMEYNFFNYRNPKNRFIFGSPYLFGGPGVFLFGPDPAEKKGNVTSVQPVILVGLGYKQQIGQYWNIGVEFGERFTFTDYLDNVSDQEVVTKLQRGNKYDFDSYTFLSFNLTYTLKEIICPFDYMQFDDHSKK